MYFPLKLTLHHGLQVKLMQSEFLLQYLHPNNLALVNFILGVLFVQVFIQKSWENEGE